MLNRIVLIGRLTADPTLRYTPTGVPVASFTLAVERPFKNAQGQKEADFIDVICWRKLADLCSQYLAKGRMVALEGRLQIRSYEKDGQKRKVAEVVAENVQFLDKAKDGGQTPASASADVGDDVSIDDLPF